MRKTSRILGRSQLFLSTGEEGTPYKVLRSLLPKERMDKCLKFQGREKCLQGSLAKIREDDEISADC